ncbi:MAG: PGRS family protein [Minicystis sp.]
MNGFRWFTGAVALLGMVAVAHASGCIVPAHLDDCDYYPGATCGTTGTGGGGGDGGPPPGCVPNESTEPVANACGVFVSSSLGDDANVGTKDKPLKTLGAALTKAKGKPVYACGESFSEAVAIGESAMLYGALDCTKGWAYDASKKTQLSADADAIPLTVTKATTSAEVLDFAITAADAMKDGGSSIAVLVAQAAVSFTRCDVTAGSGKAGLSGAPYQMPAQVGSDGNPGNAACSANSIIGADSVANACGNGDSISGIGGTGTTNSGGAGSPGEPQGSMNGGAGENATMACTAGTKGDDGSPGSAGTGATGIGTLSASGYTGASSGNGGIGKPGQGGGGGGGAKGGGGAGMCPAGTTGGASGGSGGAGGCGGLGGHGGMPGGASIALVSLDATLSFASVTLKAGSGGAGGDGGAGQLGGDGGKLGAGGKAKPTYPNLNDACAGGPGGKGGDGGKGGGGLGGHALGIAATGKALAMTGVVFTKGTAGTGGKGDNTNGNMGDGAMGIAADCWDFAANATCK